MTLIGQFWVMIWFLWKDGSIKYLNGVRRASKLVLDDKAYLICLSRGELVDIFLFCNRIYAARGSVKIKKGCSRVYNLYTIPLYRKRGYSSLILQKCIQIAQENKCPQIDAIIRKDNKASRKLHRKFKFKRQHYNAKKYKYILEIKNA